MDSVFMSVLEMSVWDKRLVITELVDKGLSSILCEIGGKESKLDVRPFGARACSGAERDDVVSECGDIVLRNVVETSDQYQ